MVNIVSCDTIFNSYSKKDIILKDSIVLDNISKNTPHSFSVLKKRNSNVDSCILIFNRTKKEIISVDPLTKKIEKLAINSNLLKRTDDICITNDTLYCHSNEINLFNILKKVNLKTNAYTETLLSDTSFFNFFSITNYFNVIDNKVLLYHLGFYNFDDTMQFKESFSRNNLKLVSVNPLTNKPIIEEVKAPFPKKYVKKYYYDGIPYPLTQFRSRDEYVYVMRFTDTVFYYNHGKLNYIQIPKQYSVQSPPLYVNAPGVGTIENTNNYLTENSHNLKAQLLKDKICVFQQIGQPHINEYDEIVQFTDCEKRMLLFDISTSKLIGVYSFPAHFEVITTPCFNNEIIFHSYTKSKKTIFYVAKLP